MTTGTIRIGDIAIALTLKSVKNVHLTVHPPSGRVTLVAPTQTRPEVARAYAASKLGWIRKQQTQLRKQARETPREYVGRESHYLWGRRYLLAVKEANAKPSVRHDHRRITLTVRPGSGAEKRKQIMQGWHRALLREKVPALIRKWEAKLGVTVAGYCIRRMKTKWGSCNHKAGNILLNSELAKKPRDLLEYVVVHEMAHLIEPTHNERFTTLLDQHYPSWRDARAELNNLPLGAEVWNN